MRTTENMEEMSWHGDCLTILMGVSKNSGIQEQVEDAESRQFDAPPVAGRLSALLAAVLKYAAHAGKYAADSAPCCSEHEQKHGKAPSDRQSSN